MQTTKVNDIKKRHSKRQLKRRRQQLIRRTITLTTLSLILLSIIIFLTPLLHVRGVEIVGNSKIATSELEPIAESLKGRNLLLTGKKDVMKEMSVFAYIDNISVDKKLFPPSVTVEISECIPAAVLVHNSSLVIIDASGKILETGAEKPEVAEVSGLKLTSANPGEIISLDDNAKRETVLDVLSDFKKSGLLSGVTKISFEDIDNITFNYENRIDGICGPYVDFGRKLSLFREAITSNKLTENSRGTIDLTKTGKAVYTP